MIFGEVMGVLIDNDSCRTDGRIHDVPPGFARRLRACFADAQINFEPRAIGNQVYDLHRTLQEPSADRHSAVVALRMHGKTQIDLALGCDEYETCTLGHDLQPLIPCIVGKRTFLDDSGPSEMPCNAHTLPDFVAFAINDD
jgi:hypothetical protein